MNANPCLRLILSTIFTLVFALVSAQTAFQPLVIKNPYPRYKLSLDGRTLAIYEKTTDDKIFAMFLDVESFKVNPKGSFVLDNLTLTPDLKGAWGQLSNTNGFKGNEHWLAYKNYTAWYYANNLDFEKQQWPDKYFILGARSDGMLVVAGNVKIKKPSKTGPYNPLIVLTDVHIVDPTTGQIKETLFKGDLIEANNDWFKGRHHMLLDDGELLVWSYDFSRALHAINLRKGGIVSTPIPFHMNAFFGKYAVGTARNNLVSGNARHRKLVVNLETGATVSDQEVGLGNSFGYWVGPGGNSNSFYSLNGGNAMLYKEEITDGKHRITDSLKLDIDGLFFRDYFIGVESITHKLIVSEATRRVLLLPTSWGEGEHRHGYIWDLSNGKLLYKSENPIQPFESFVSKNTRVYKAPVKVTLAPNVMVLARDKNLYQVISKASTGTLWNVIQFHQNETGPYGRYEMQKAEFDLTYEAKPVKATTCAQCNGGGSTVSISQRTVEKTDKMIYNQITTTTTMEDRKTHSCTACKGLGFTYHVE
ncbi:MAG TPA: hypothetical protein VD884_09020 [Ohtaekwangia sp.]|nr:hypothetical protein [Ohtaekwangia sp.]